MANSSSAPASMPSAWPSAVASMSSAVRSGGPVADLGAFAGASHGAAGMSSLVLGIFSPDLEARTGGPCGRPGLRARDRFAKSTTASSGVIARQPRDLRVRWVTPQQAPSGSSIWRISGRRPRRCLRLSRVAFASTSSAERSSGPVAEFGAVAGHCWCLAPGGSPVLTRVSASSRPTWRPARGPGGRPGLGARDRFAKSTTAWSGVIKSQPRDLRVRWATPRQAPSGSSIWRIPWKHLVVEEPREAGVGRGHWPWPVGYELRVATRMGRAQWQGCSSARRHSDMARRGDGGTAGGRRRRRGGSHRDVRFVRHRFAVVHDLVTLVEPSPGQRQRGRGGGTARRRGGRRGGNGGDCGAGGDGGTVGRRYCGGGGAGGDCGAAAGRRRGGLAVRPDRPR